MEKTSGGGEAGYPQVFVVDSQAPVSFMPKATPYRDGNKRRLYVFYVLLGLALLGVVIEAGLIYRLYRNLPKTAQTLPQDPQKLKGDNRDMDGSYEITSLRDEGTNDRKPLAFLQGSVSDKIQDGVIQWLATITLEGLKYEEGKLLILKDGYYYIYSKVYFSETCSFFTHLVIRSTPRYSVPLELMKSTRYTCVDSEENKEHPESLANSFLGGVFQLYTGDAVYVSVKDANKIRTGVIDNFFGVFMI